MAYFKYFPKIRYDVRGVLNNKQYDLITNILRRVRMRLALIDNTVFFAQHSIVDGETPEQLAYTFYGDSELHWIILYGQQATHPFYDWPLKYYDLSNFVTKKYGSSEVYSTHHYEDVDGYVVDSDASGATTISNFLYEEQLNDLKRQLSVIRPEYTAMITNELKTLVS
jgi:hypothetical protein